MKVLLITGASSDIGIHLIEKLIDLYDIIWAHYNTDLSQIELLKEKYPNKIKGIAANFSEIDSINMMINTIIKSEIIPTDILHLSADKYMLSNFSKMKWDYYQKNIDISVRSIVYIINAFIPYMVKAKKGHILFMLSSCTLNNPPMFCAPYVMTKYALLGLMKELAVEYEGKGILVNGVSPGMIETKFLENIPRLIIEKNAKENALNRNLRVEDLDGIVKYLLSEEAHLTGQNIEIKAI